MKRLILFILFLTPAFAFCQSADTPVEASLFLPAHVVKGLTADQKLTIHYVLEGPEEKWETSKIVAKKVKDNVYGFSLKQGMYFRLVFVIGDYSYNMSCIDNRSGEAMDKYTFNVLLEKRKFNPDELKFIAPCIARDDE